ncbi:FecR family protein [bacterium A37T11]|nr:FecR family protein [bacterium A37T11]
MKEDRLIFLFQRAIAHTATPEEQEELFALLADPMNASVANALLKEAWSSYVPGNPIFNKLKGQGLLENILSRQSVESSPRLGRWIHTFVRIAALVILVSLLGSYFILKKPSTLPPLKQQSLTEAVKANKIVPGTPKAVLKLDGGRTVNLSGKQTAIMVKKGRIQYENGEEVVGSEAQFFTVTTPKGGEYQVILPDGSRVHLNAASSLRYPAHFSKKRREVELQGEAFFEVQATPAYPFYVKSGKQEAVALGTSFNIDAYKSTIATTTLVEGSMFIKNENGPKWVLVNNKTIINDQENGKMQMATAALDEVLAWHRGYFIFDDAPIQCIMEKVSRWYNVEVVYKGDMKDKKFGGMYQRSKSLYTLLANLKETGLIDFIVEGRRLTVIAK